MHKPSCYQVRARIELERRWYMTAWPNYCIECGGAGCYWISDDPSPSGVSLSSGHYDYFESCESCIDRGICPRCGEKVTWINEGSCRGTNDIEYYECHHCGWTNHNAVIAGISEHDECECWELDYDTRYL